MDREPRSMCLLHQYTSSSARIGHPDLPLESYMSSVICHKLRRLPNHSLSLAVLWFHGLRLGLSNGIQGLSHHCHRHTYISNQGTLCSMDQGVGYHVSLTRMIQDLIFTLFHHIQPSPLTHIQVELVNEILQALVVRVYGTPNPI